MNKEEQKHIEKIVGKFMTNVCNNLENVWRDDAGEQLVNLVYNTDKKYKDQHIEPMHVIIESIIRFYQQKMVEWLEMMGEANIEEIPEKFKYIIDRDSVEQRIFSYFLDTDEKGKVIKKNPLYDNLIYSQPIEGEIH